MAGLRVWIVVLALLVAGPVSARCAQPPAVEFSDTRANAAALFLEGIGDNSDVAWRRPGEQAQEGGACAVQWIAAWAKAGAWLEEIGSEQAEAERAESLAGVALAFLKVRSFASDQEREAIEGWLIQVADLASAKIKPGDARRYWLGLGVGAVGMAVGSDRHWDAARAIAEAATAGIGADGTLPVEMVKDKALHGHVLALMPLVTLATLARAQGEDFYALGGGGLDRLAGYVAKGVSAQPDLKPGAGWSQLYALHAADAAGAKIGMPRSCPALGGDVQMLVRALGASEQE